MVEIDVGDIRQMYEHTIVMHGNKPVYISRVGDRGEVRFTDLLSQKKEVEEFSLKAFTPPAARRLGMINTCGSVVYASRVPIRRYKVGISFENLKVDSIRDIEYPEGKEQTVNRIRQLEAREIAEAMLNKYPKLKEALKTVEKYGGAVAFDKQFAVDWKRRIIYKTKVVGSIPPGVDTVDGIQFNKGYEQLGLLLDGKYEKAIRAVKA